MIKEIAISISFLSPIILLISVLIYLAKYNRLPSLIKTLGIFLLISIATEIFSKYLSFLKVNNLFLLHIFTLLEFISWSLFYKLLFKEKEEVQKYSWYFIITVSLLIIINTMFIEPYTGFNSNAKSLVQIILISYAIYYFFRSFGVVDFSQPINKAISFINFAVVLYYSGSLFIFMFSRFLMSDNVSNIIQEGFWLLNALLNLVFQILILIAIWKIAFNKKKSLS